jgi:hypothetical protein
VNFSTEEISMLDIASVQRHTGGETGAGVNISDFRPTLTVRDVFSAEITSAVVSGRPSPSFPDLRAKVNGPKRFVQASIPIDADAVVLQLWEGRVGAINAEEGYMDAVLTAKIGDVEDHVAELSLQFVCDQDLDLLQPGAIFYLTLSRRTLKSGSVKMEHELRFRRRPQWSRLQVEAINADADRLFAFINR